MIKVDIRSDVLKETKNRMDVGVHMKVDVEGSGEILEEEVYLLVKKFEKKIPKIWGNVIDRVIDDMTEGDEE